MRRPPSITRTDTLSPYTTRVRSNVLNLTTWRMLLGAVLAWPVTLAFPQQDIVWEPVLFWGVAYMAIIASGLGWWLWLSVVRRVSATVASMSILGVPVLTVILAWLLLSERPTLLELIGDRKSTRLNSSH